MDIKLFNHEKYISQLAFFMDDLINSLTIVMISHYAHDAPTAEDGSICLMEKFCRKLLMR